MTGRRDPHWRCAWCLRWNEAADSNCAECGRDLPQIGRARP